MRRPAAAVLVVLAALVGCGGVSAEDQPRAVAGGELPVAGPSASTPAPAPTGEEAAGVYFVRDDLLVRTTRLTPRNPTPETLLLALLQGPTQQESETGLSTRVPDVPVSPTLSRSGIVTVEVPASVLIEERIAYGQIVLTLALSERVDGVAFVRDGVPLPVPRADGSLTPGPVTDADYRDLVQ